MKSLVDVQSAQGNGRVRMALRTFALVSLLACGVLGAEGVRAQGGLADPPPTPTADELAAARADLEMVFDGFEDLGLECGLTPVLPGVADGRAALAARGDDELMPLVQTRAEIQELGMRISDMHALLEASGRCGGDTTRVEPRDPDTHAAPGDAGRSGLKTLPTRYYEDFPRADYSTICGNPALDGDAWFVARLIWEVAKLGTDLAHDACEWLVVALGGANVALACIPVDIAYGIADVVFTMYEFCIDDAAAARASAVLDDTEHLHTDIEYMQEDVDFIKDAVTCRPVLPLRRGSVRSTSFRSGPR